MRAMTRFFSSIEAVHVARQAEPLANRPSAVRNSRLLRTCFLRRGFPAQVGFLAARNELPGVRLLMKAIFLCVFVFLISCVNGKGGVLRRLIQDVNFEEQAFLLLLLCVNRRNCTRTERNILTT